MGEHERLDGLLRGTVGSLAGLTAMGLFFKATNRLNNGSSGDSGGSEPATATVGRLAYEGVAGHAPDEETRRRLGQAVHWGYGVLVGGLYGALRADTDDRDLLAGLGYGTALWAIGDEVMVPVLGLAEGPTAHSWKDHATALGAHLAYGAATATATRALRRVM